MHGIIFAELRNYAETKHGKGTWNQLLKQSGLDNRVYLPIKAYPDTEVVALIGAASSMAGIPVAELVEDFGEFITPALMKMFGHLLLPEWKTIDVIDNTEGTVHSVVRAKNPGTKPPELQTVRRSYDEVVLIYTSPARCAPSLSASERAWRITFMKILRLFRRCASTKALQGARLCSVRLGRPQSAKARNGGQPLASSAAFVPTDLAETHARC
jgi:Haem-NO-binding